jgi:lipopolysaccharide export system permease protein
MRILFRYIGREFIRVFVVCLAAVTVVYLVAHFIGKLDDFIEHRASLTLIATFVLLKIPRLAYEVLPIVVLLATLITLRGLAVNSEIIAMRACGIGLSRLLVPVLCVTAILVGLILMDGERLVPLANQEASYLEDVALKKRPHILALRKNRIWFRTGDSSFCNIQKVDPDTASLHHVTLYTFDADFHLVSRIDANQLSWDGKGWVSDQATHWTFDPSGGIASERVVRGSFPLAESLDEMINVEKSSREMGYGELKDYIRILKRDGYPVTAYEVDLHAKISYAVISLIMVLIAVPFALRSARSGGIGISIGLSVLIGFAYWIAYSVGLSFGYAGILPPAAAAWIGNVVFGAGALWATLRVRF